MLKVVKEACEAVSPTKQLMHIVPVDVTASEDMLKKFVDKVISIAPHVHYCFLAAGVPQSLGRLWSSA